MTDAHLGDVWLVDLGEPVGREQAGRRPAVVVSADEWNALPAGVVIVVPITSSYRRLESHIEVEANDSGLEQTSYAKCEDVRSVSEQRLIHRLGIVGPDALFRIGRALRYLLDL